MALAGSSWRDGKMDPGSFSKLKWLITTMAHAAFGADTGKASFIA